MSQPVVTITELDDARQRAFDCLDADTTAWFHFTGNPKTSWTAIFNATGVSVDDPGPEIAARLWSVSNPKTFDPKVLALLTRTGSGIRIGKLSTATAHEMALNMTGSHADFVRLAVSHTHATYYERRLKEMDARCEQELAAGPVPADREKAFVAEYNALVTERRYCPMMDGGDLADLAVWKRWWTPDTPAAVREMLLGSEPDWSGLRALIEREYRLALPLAAATNSARTETEPNDGNRARGTEQHPSKRTTRQQP